MTNKTVEVKEDDGLDFGPTNKEIEAAELEAELEALAEWEEMALEQEFLDDIVIKVRMEDGSLMETWMSTTDYKC